MSGDGLELPYLEDGRADEKYKKDELGLCEAELKLASNTTDEEFRERYQKDYFNPN